MRLKQNGMTSELLATERYRKWDYRNQKHQSVNWICIADSLTFITIIEFCAIRFFVLDFGPNPIAFALHSAMVVSKIQLNLQWMLWLRVISLYIQYILISSLHHSIRLVHGALIIFVSASTLPSIHVHIVCRFLSPCLCEFVCVFRWMVKLWNVKRETSHRLRRHCHHCHRCPLSSSSSLSLSRAYCLYAVDVSYPQK